MSNDLTDMVPGRWIKPGSRHHNVVHYVHRDLVLRTNTDRVTVLWPKKGKKGPEKWDAVIVQDSSNASVPITTKIKLLYA